MKKLFVTALIGASFIIGAQPANANRITPERRYVNHVNNTLIQEGFNPIDELTLLEYGQSLCQLKTQGYHIHDITFSIINNNRNQGSPEQFNAGRRTLILAGAAAEVILCP